MVNFHQFKSFFNHRFNSKTLHGTHSPFVYQFLEEVIYFKGHYYNYDLVESIRKKMLLDNRILTIDDLGAGSKKLKNQRSVKQIAKTSVKNKKLGELLYRIAIKIQAKNSLELGTSLGITTAYLALANLQGQVFSIEGDNGILHIAKENFEKLNLKNINGIHGDFDSILPDLINKNIRFDLVYIDGNHRKEPTLRYLNWLLPSLNKNACIIFDDIYWSKEMTEAWEMIIKTPEFTVTIDLFSFGLAFIRPQQQKEHFTIRI